MPEILGRYHEVLSFLCCGPRKATRPFHAHPQGPTWRCSQFPQSLKGQLHPVWSPGVLRVKAEHVLEPLAARPPGGTSLDPSAPARPQQEEWRSCRTHPRGPGRSARWRLVPSLPWKPAAVPHVLQEPARAVRVPAATAAPPGAAASPPGPSPPRSRQPRSHIWGSLMPGLTAASHVDLPTLLCVPHSPLPSVGTAVPATTRATQWVRCGGRWPGRICTGGAPSPVNAHGRSCPVPASTGILKRLKRRADRGRKGRDHGGLSG